MDLYFSHFGRVEGPPSTLGVLRLEHLPLSPAEDCRYCAWTPPGTVLWTERTHGLTITAYADTPGTDTAILVVECPGKWLEEGIVTWPAAIAGRCCAPRYGL